MIVWFIILIVNGIDALPSGAPKSACSTLLPRHAGIAAQITVAPYEIKAELSGHKDIVNISSPHGENFEGFILQARSAKDPSKFIDGEFTISQFSKTIDCFDSNKNTLTHVNRNTKSEILTEWTPKEQLKEEVIFRATIAKQYHEFWTEVDSNPVKLQSDTGTVIKKETLYEKCFKEEGCVGMPSGCIEQQDCEVLLRYSKSSDGINFNLQGLLEGYTTNYMAMAWSEDSIMGEDSVTECIRDGTNVIARESWNEGKSNTRTKELSKNNYSGLFVDGLASCSWTSPLVTVSNGQTYDFTNKNYHILLAIGEVSEWRLKYHDKRMASAEALNLTEFNVADEVSDPKVEDGSRDNEDQQPSITPPPMTTDSVSTKEEKINYLNETATHTGSTSCLRSPSLMFIFSALLFATKESINYYIFKYLF